MALREFTDSEGVRWRVWSTLPTSAVTLTSGFERGWLTFECASCLRRLAPVPTDWEAATAERLQEFCEAAREVPRHTSQAD